MAVLPWPQSNCYQTVDWFPRRKLLYNGYGRSGSISSGNKRLYGTTNKHNKNCSWLSFVCAHCANLEFSYMFNDIQLHCWRCSLLRILIYEPFFYLCCEITHTCQRKVKDSEMNLRNQTTQIYQSSYIDVWETVWLRRHFWDTCCYPEMTP